MILRKLGLVVMGAIAAPLVYAELMIRRTETLDAIRDSPGGHNVDVKGIAIHYETTGEGPLIMLIHGFAGSTYAWRKNLGPIAEAGFRVLALDLPGFGYSQRSPRPVFTPTAQAEVVQGMISAVDSAGSDATPRQRMVLVGNSLGAATAVRFAIDYPELTRGLVLVAPAVGYRRAWRKYGRILRLPILGPLVVRPMYYFLLGRESGAQRMLESAYGSRIDGVTPEMREAWFRPMRVKGTATSALGLARSRDDRPIIERLNEIRVPVLIIAGEQDRVIPVAAVKRLHDRLPNSRFVVMHDAGHLAQEDQADTFNQLVLEFMTSLP